ncbi:hybrid sensor histidine kinase/response regulator [Pseudodesulfovibrio thermohalotolerans]|uniref:hybrid sensor histidine kinase/response regulator n=1 Tax=Pseudodesulfovibrio thermohalotolerans TaxID=2880651 RepID=UPI002442292E|nr:hybrid sensor histidine kinase/response regulator [Pseudodesulfovibrio thermohalotolerans]WFS63428.1 hybrid sensor histidine kinase/response regulator [Pseudodesulfovibrio thermohalotolerans]
MNKTETILLVDDQPENITIMIEALHSQYTLLAATDGAFALERAASEPRPDLILLDVMMPGMSGHDVCSRLKSNPATQDIPVIFVTSLDAPDDEARGLRLGASDYITKPISPPVVQARVRTHLDLKRAREQLQRQNTALEELVRERTVEVVEAQRERVESLKHFAAAMAHQIRNPVMSIGGMAGLLLRRAPEGSRLADYAEAVREDSLRLESLVGDVSEYVSLSAGAFHEVRVEGLVEAALARAREAVGEPERLRVESALQPALVRVDERIVVMALAEIAINALEFGGNGEVCLSIRGGAEAAPGWGGADRARYGIQLSDDGPGIDGAILPYVTDPFFTTKARGVGMGLTKVKRVVCDEHGGTLRVESPATTSEKDGGQGTSVLLDLPLA